MPSHWNLELVRLLFIPPPPLSNPCHLIANDLIAQRAVAIEKAVADELGTSTGGYKAKIRSLFVNLKDKNNPSLRESVVSGDISPIKFANMTSEVCIRCSAKTRGSPLHIRKWPLESDKPQIERLSKTTCSTPWAQQSNRQKLMPSSVVVVNRFVGQCYSKSLLLTSPEEKMSLPPGANP